MERQHRLWSDSGPLKMSEISCRFRTTSERNHTSLMERPPGHPLPGFVPFVALATTHVPSVAIARIRCGQPHISKMRRIGKALLALAAVSSALRQPLFGGAPPNQFLPQNLLTKVRGICESAVRKSEHTQCGMNDGLFNRNFTQSPAYQECMEDW